MKCDGGATAAASGKAAILAAPAAPAMGGSAPGLSWKVSEPAVDGATRTRHARRDERLRGTRRIRRRTPHAPRFVKVRGVDPPCQQPGHHFGRSAQKAECSLKCWAGKALLNALIANRVPRPARRGDAPAAGIFTEMRKSVSHSDQGVIASRARSCPYASIAYGRHAHGLRAFALSGTRPPARVALDRPAFS